MRRGGGADEKSQRPVELCYHSFCNTFIVAYLVECFVTRQMAYGEHSWYLPPPPASAKHVLPNPEFGQGIYFIPGFLSTVFSFRVPSFLGWYFTNGARFFFAFIAALVGAGLHAAYADFARAADPARRPVPTPSTSTRSSRWAVHEWHRAVGCSSQRSERLHA